jgi:hypothetical protein
MVMAAMGGGSLSAVQVNQSPFAEVPTDWIFIVDDTGQIGIAVPPTWQEIDTVPDGSGQPWISATTDRFLFFPAEGTADTYSEPGIIYRGFNVAADPVEWLDTSLYHGFCTAGPMQPFEENALFVGFLQQFFGCGGSASVITQVAASRVDNAEFSVFLHVQLVSDDDETLRHLLQSMS